MYKKWFNNRLYVFKQLLNQFNIFQFLLQINGGYYLNHNYTKSLRVSSSAKLNQILIHHK